MTGTLWDELVAAALLGTERRPFEGPVAPGPLGDLVDGASLADAAAATWAYLEAGRRAPVGAGPLRPPAPDDDRPLLPRRTVRALAAILADPHLRILLDEWLELARSDGRRLPARWLPDLLDTVGDPARADVEAVAGPRAAWLAAQNPAWDAADTVPDGLVDRLLDLLRRADEPGEELGRLWAGPDGLRTAVFVRVRAVDPDAGRRLLRHIWADEPGATRAAIVGALGPGLSGADEEFLERCLDDRRRDVRAAAADLLDRLPASRRAQRMAARTRPLVTLQGPPPVPVVAAPPEADRAARRDGDPGGADADRLVTLVGATPLADWEPALGRPTDDLVAMAAAAARSDAPAATRAAALLAGWSRAAARQEDRGWAARLLAAGARPEPGLLRLVDAGPADRAVTTWLARTPLAAAVGLILDLPRPWSERVTEAVMDAVAHLISASANPAAPPGRPAQTGAAPDAEVAPVRDALIPMATRMDPGRPELAARPVAALEAVPDRYRPGARLYWGRHLDRMVVLVNFRHHMRQEFR